MRPPFPITTSDQWLEQWPSAPWVVSQNGRDHLRLRHGDCLSLFAKPGNAAPPNLWLAFEGSCATVPTACWCAANCPRTASAPEDGQADGRQEPGDARR